MPTYLQVDGNTIAGNVVICPRHVYSSTYNRTYSAWVDQGTSGGVWVGQFDHATGYQTSFRLATGTADNHCEPAIIILANGTLVVAYALNHTANNVLVQTSVNPGDISSWNAVVTITDTGFGAGAYEYRGLYQFAASGNVYLFYMVIDASNGRHLHYRKSTDNGATWGAAGAFTEACTPFSFEQNYFCFSSDSGSRIDFAHMRVLPVASSVNAIYHFYVTESAGALKFFKSDGTDITASVPFNFNSMTVAYSAADTTSGSRMWDVVTNGGNPAIVYSAYVDSTFTDHRYRMARWVSGAWTLATTDIATGSDSGSASIDATGTSLSGGAAINPANINEVALSRFSSVSTQFEIQDYQTSNSGTSWSKNNDITSGTPAGAGNKNGHPRWVQSAGPISVIWWRGSFTNYNNYNTNLYDWPVLLPVLIAKDSFTDVAATSLQNHYPECGSHYNSTLGGPLKIDSNGTLYGGVTGVSFYYLNNPTPQSVNYKASLDFKPITNLSDTMSLFVRNNGSDETGYSVTVNISAGTIQLHRFVAAVATSLINTNQTWTNGTTYTVTLQALGTGATVNIFVAINGVPVAGMNPYADSDPARLLTGNNVGIRANIGTIGTATTGLHADNLLVLEQVIPYLQMDWPNPMRAILPRQPDSPSSLLVGLLATPFAQTDWSNPRRPVQPAQPDSPSSLLVGLLANPFSQGDWRNPVLVKQPIQPAIPPSWLVGVLASPFAQPNWPNPLLARLPLQPDSLASLLVGPLAQPFSQTDWPNPARPALPRQPEGPPNLLTILYVTQAPFYQLDWPNPARFILPRQPEGPPNLIIVAAVQPWRVISLTDQFDPNRAATGQNDPNRTATGG